MVQKRGAEGKTIGRPPKKSRAVNRMQEINEVLVTEAISNAEVLPTDLREALSIALPTIFKSDKVDRHPYELEVVEQAEKALSVAQASLEEAHAAAMTTQNEVSEPAEHARRTALMKDAEAGEQAAKASLEEKKELQTAARKAKHSADSDLKEIDKEQTKTENQIQAHTEKRASLNELLVNEYVALKEGTSSGRADKKIVKKLETVGKQCGLDDTMLQTLSLMSKKEPNNRSEFENMILKSLKDAIDREIESFAQKIAELEPSKAGRNDAISESRAAIEKAEAAVEAATAEVAAAQAKCKEAGKEVSKANDYLYAIWQDMKQACDKQDDAIDLVTDFKDKVLPAFQQLKEKEKEAETKEDEQEALGEEPEQEAEPVEEAEEEEAS